MRNLLIVILAMMAQSAMAQNVTARPSPLSAYSNEWDKPMYAACNTAQNDSHMNAHEKEVIYIINLARTYPTLFANTVLSKYPALSGKQALSDDVVYYQSLVKTMTAMNQLPMLYPDEKCFLSAECHALESGKTGYTGHVRKTDECKTNQYFFGECCDYGNEAPAEIVLTLLIDQNIANFGHRKILLGSYSKIGVSIQPHKIYGFNTVLDFYK